MAELLAFCGLSCQTCPIYLATRQENFEEKTRIRIEIVRLCKGAVRNGLPVGRHHRLRLVARRMENDFSQDAESCPISAVCQREEAGKLCILP